MIKVKELRIKLEKLDKDIKYYSSVKNLTIHQEEMLELLIRLRRSYEIELEKAKERSPVVDDEDILGFNYRDWRYQ